MNNHTFSGQLNGKQITVKRISKKTAKKLFEQGKTIYVQSSNFKPFGVWSQAIDINNQKDCFLSGVYSFEQYVKSFEQYNCSYQQGYYTSFYIEVVV